MLKNVYYLKQKGIKIIIVMVTKAEAKLAWDTIKMFSMANKDMSSMSKEDVTKGLQIAVIKLNEYFSEEKSNV